MDRCCRLEEGDQRMGETGRGDIAAEVLDGRTDGSRDEGLRFGAGTESAGRLDPHADVGIAQRRLETAGISPLLSPGPAASRLSPISPRAIMNVTPTRTDRHG